MAVDPAVLAQEQKYFDTASDAREATRTRLGRAGSQAGGNAKVAAAVDRAAREAAERIADASEAVALGRFDRDGETLYVGKHAIQSPDRDLLVINWQADAAQAFYQARIGDTFGVEWTRKFKTDRNTITAYEDAVFADLAERVASLTEEERIGVDDTLLDDLSRTRDGAMRDIVQTIHHSQDDIIRTPIERLLVVQGGPGTGKTVVALHRVSWLLFHNRGTIEPREVLVIGPNKTFSKYISQVLPGLGDEGVSNAELDGLGPNVVTGRVEPLEAARLKGDSRMAAMLRRALHNRIRFPRGETELSIGPAGAIRIPSAVIESQLDKVRSATTYNVGRTQMRQWLQEQARERTPGTVSVTPASIDAALERVWPQLTAQAFLQDLLGSRPQIGDAAGDDFTAGDVTRLYRQSADRLADETWSIADVALLDEADMLINGPRTTYSHVVVDEAQDLSPMQCRSIRRRSGNGSYTIVGDIAQSTGPWSRDSWDDVIEALQADAEAIAVELEYGYRVPRQIFEFAAQVLPLAAPNVTPPTVVREGTSEPDILEADVDDLAAVAVASASSYAGRGLFVGIICAENAHDQIAAALTRADVTYDDAGEGRLGKSINLLTAEQAKGLEFEAAVVVEPSAIAGDSVTGHRLLYVALTRTTKHITVAHSEAFPLLGLGQTAAIDSEGTVPDEGDSGTKPAAASTNSLEGDSPAPRPAGRQRARRSAAQILASDIADEVRDQLQPSTWQDFIEALEAELSEDKGS